MATSDTRSIPWVIEQHTRVKHRLLSSYMATWMKIMWQQQELTRRPAHLIYVDGFAGPGEYWATEDQKEKVDGSPLLVGKIANDLLKAQRKLDIFAFDACTSGSGSVQADIAAPLALGDCRWRKWCQGSRYES